MYMYPDYEGILLLVAEDPRATQHPLALEAWQITYSLHCSSFLGLPFRILNIDLAKPKKGTTMETIGRAWACATEH